MTTLSRVRVPFLRTVSPVKPDCDNDNSSKIWVLIGPLVSLANPDPFLQSSYRRFGCGLDVRPLASYVVMGADAHARASARASCMRREAIG